MPHNNTFDILLLIARPGAVTLRSCGEAWGRRHTPYALKQPHGQSRRNETQFTGMRIIDFHGRVTFISLLLSGLCVMLLMLAAGCAAAGDGVLPAPPEETPPSFTFDSASKDELAAARTGLSILAASKQDAVGSPQLIEAQKGPLSEALNRLYNTSAIHYDVWPPETKVWLVVFKGSWQIYPPPDATGEASLPPRYVGCAYALFMAADGQPIQAGDTPCPP